MLHERPGTSELPKVVELTIPILENMELAATQTAEAVAHFMAFDREQIDEVKQALIEACVNAFEHSNSTAEKVHIRFDMHPDQLTVTIRDFGHGFDPATVPAPEIHAKVSGADAKKRGWGLALMAGLMDEVHVDSGPAGTTITMTKRRNHGGSSD